MSAYQFMHGEFDYNKLLLAPLGCAVQMHESPNRQKNVECTLTKWVVSGNVQQALLVLHDLLR
jgi:hypothetical protein